MHIVKWLNSSIWSTNRTLTNTNSTVQSGSRNNDKGVPKIPQSSRTGASPSDAVYYYTKDTSSIWPIHGILTATTNPDQIEPGSNCNEGVLHISQSPRTGASPSNRVSIIPGHFTIGAQSQNNFKLIIFIKAV